MDRSLTIIYTAPARICTTLIVSRTLPSLANNVWRYVCNNCARQAYVMWACLGHSRICTCCFKCSNHWKQHGHFKWNRALGFVFSIHSSIYGATTVATVSLFSTWTRSTISIYLCKRRNRPFCSEQKSLIKHAN